MITRLRFRLCFFMLGIVCCHLGFAGVVNVQTAQQLALNFFNLRSSAAARSGETAELQYQRIESDGVTDYYVFNMQPVPGFVIIAGADNVTPVLAYSAESSFLYDATADAGISDWLNITARKMHRAINDRLTAYGNVPALWNAYLQGNDPADMKSNDTVGPLLTTTWDQLRRVNNHLVYNAPYWYNNICPGAGGLNCPAGCNAVSMAQILNYYKFPLRGSGSYSYTVSPYGTLSADFGSTLYLWDLLPVAINATNYQTDSAEELDMLIYHCAVSVNMLFTSGSSSSSLSSGANSALHAYTTYFGYDTGSMKAVAADTVSDSAAWFNLIKTEIDARRVVQYRGWDSLTSDGHIWVCDGYELTGSLHMNWGWGGMYNGFYRTGALNPNGANEFNSGDVILVGIKPGNPAGIQVSQNRLNNIQLYPNPTTDQLYIKTENIQPQSITIYDVDGRLIFTQTFKPELNINQLSTGVYFIEVKSNEGVTRKQFAKM